MSSVDSALGCQLVGVILTALFYGVTLGQIWFYFRTYTADASFMRVLVGILWVLDTAQLVLVMQSLYMYAVTWRGDVEALGGVSMQFEASMAVTTMVAFIVQMIYAYRIWRLSFRNWYITLTIGTLSLFALASGFTLLAKTIQDPHWDHSSINSTPAALILISTVLCDFVIAASQVYLFNRGTVPHQLHHRQHYSPSRSRPRQYKFGPGPKRGRGSRLGGVISRLTVLVVNVGLLTSVDVTVFLVLFLVCPANGAYIVPYLLLCNCYLNSFLSVLNSRRRLRNIAAADNGIVHTSIFDIHFDVDPEVPQDLVHPPSLAHARSHATLSQVGSKGSLRTHPHALSHSRSGLLRGTTGNVSVDLALELAFPSPGSDDADPELGFNTDTDSNREAKEAEAEADLGELEIQSVDIGLSLDLEEGRVGAGHVEEDRGTFGIVSLASLPRTLDLGVDLESAVAPVKTDQEHGDGDVEEMNVPRGRMSVQGWVGRVFGAHSGHH
ncbi:hypothetical protein FIBSPDRAFT_1044272 [Athelia psychrophila]|uniref:DUF6534 domain-containing protein n=1 Tax=Athelia psychrophila TaxID=1759441 RepID=A0A166JXU9_9AGAM|nr:hypothetical protein FIBSPDRAFT_1044272 [Fibularhizoctonia sp. CBS 109695]